MRKPIRVPFAKPAVGRPEAELVHDLIMQGHLTSSAFDGGRMVREFEGLLREKLGTKHVVSVNSGTAALMAALLAAHMPQGGEVIMPSFTFPATANAVLMCGGRPVFCDVDPQTLCLSPEEVRRRITSKTWAVIPVHLYGTPCDMDEIQRIADERGLLVIEDAAQALGSRWRGRPAGTLGHMGCFSFYPSKLITSGEGGAVATDDDRLASRLRLVRNQGMGGDAEVRGLGLNLRLPEILAAIGVKQMERFEAHLMERRRLAAYYDEAFSKMEGIEVVNGPGESARTIYTIRVKHGRDQLLEFLASRGVEAKVFYPRPLHLQRFYMEMGLGGNRLPVSEAASREVLSLPLYPGMKREEQQYVIDTVAEGWSKISRTTP